MYRDWHTNSTFQLAEIYASQINGKVTHLDGIALARWGDRLAYKARLIEISIIDSTVYDAENVFTRSEHSVVDGFRLLFVLNQARHADSPGVMYSSDFAAVWCGVSRATATTAISKLRRFDIMRRVGQQNRTNVYVPGDGTRKPVTWTDEPGWGRDETR